MAMSILDLCQYISEDTATTVQHLQSKHLFPAQGIAVSVVVSGRVLVGRQISLIIMNASFAVHLSIRSDEWSSYSRVASLPSGHNHEAVYHSIEFVSPTGVHTQSAESYWNRVKIKLEEDERLSRAPTP